MHTVRHLIRAIMGMALLTALGCAKAPPALLPAGGTLKYADGTVPDGEIRTVRFEPTKAADGSIASHPATATLQADGTFKLMTFKPGDGALAGDYRVVLVFFGEYRAHNPVLPDVYSKAETTPLATCSVRRGEKNFFPLAVEKRTTR